MTLNPIVCTKIIDSLLVTFKTFLNYFFSVSSFFLFLFLGGGGGGVAPPQIAQNGGVIPLLWHSQVPGWIKAWIQAKKPSLHADIVVCAASQWG